MDMKNKGRLIEKFVECSNDLALAKKQVNELEAKKEKLACLISLDNELCDLIIAGGVSTIDGSLLTINTSTSKLEIKKSVTSFNIKSELTDEQLKLIGDIDER
jgi:riboflavin synthase alpha subunit